MERRRQEAPDYAANRAALAGIREGLGNVRKIVAKLTGMPFGKVLETCPRTGRTYAFALDGKGRVALVAERTSTAAPGLHYPEAMEFGSREEMERFCASAKVRVPGKVHPRPPDLDLFLGKGAFREERTA